MGTYHNANLLYRPSVSIWTAWKKDKNATAELTKGKGALATAANVNKDLLPESTELEAIRKWGNTFRGWIYNSTLPWDDSGWRIGRVVRHMEFMAEAGDRMREGDQLVEDFLRAYEREIEQSRFALNDLFNPSDYPGVNEVRAKFRFTLDVSTLPNTEDFRVVDGIPQEEVDKLVDIASSSVEIRIGDAMKEAYNRLHTVVSKMALTLQQYGDKDIKKFSDSLTGNIEDLVEVMPALNITGDPKLDDLTKQAKQLLNYDLADLRKDETVRAAAITEARELAKQFEVAVKPVERRATAAMFADMI